MLPTILCKLELENSLVAFLEFISLFCNEVRITYILSRFVSTCIGSLILKGNITSFDKRYIKLKSNKKYSRTTVTS